jgi:hypothetical protein
MVRTLNGSFDMNLGLNKLKAWLGLRVKTSNYYFLSPHRGGEAGDLGWQTSSCAEVRGFNAT